ncbi:HAD-IIA family hydrolase [Paraoerskovia marina]|uniref:HAD-IIA family hydrolase n=1 Tax=Paraoerskovia marina TaxID=545619 RepID=UPI00049228EB|nr:HAD-IIA family hydrolase [Paraoerskovia marina]
MSGGLLACDGPLIDAFDLALVDLDGVAYAGHQPIAHAADGLSAARSAGVRLVFVTNNASREPEDVAGQLSELDIPATADDVMTAAQAAAALLRTRLDVGATVLVIGGAGLRTAVSAAGLTIVDSADDAPDAVVQGFSPEVGWKDLAEAAFAVQRGAWFVASNRDLSIPQARGIAPGNGSLVAAVVAATGVEPESAGKPAPTMYQMAVDRVGGNRTLVIGDRLDTDLAGARAGGFPGLHVLTGVNSGRDAVLADASMRPHFIGRDLRALTQAHAAPRHREDGSWECGGATARVDGGRLRLDHGEASDPVDSVRAACGAVWAARDDGVRIDEDSVPEFDVR